jgi:hypothetical protein
MSELASNSRSPDLGHRRYSKIQSGKTMFSQTIFNSVFWRLMAGALIVLGSTISRSNLLCNTTHGFQNPGNASVNNNEVTPASTSSNPIMTFTDPYGQAYGRYIINETVPEVAYDFQPVVEKLYLPKTVTENKLITQVQYIPVYSYQPQLRNIYGWNPFAPPQQVWENVLVVQQQPNYVQVSQPVTYQRYEPQEVTKMVPVLTTKSKQVTKTVDRPLGPAPNGANLVANNVAPNTFQSPNNNIIQQSALIAQANRNMSRFPTRPIDYPYGGYPAPYYYNPPAAPYYVYPNTNIANAAVAPNNAAMIASNPAPNNSAPQTTVYPAMPLRPVYPGPPNAMAVNTPYQNAGYPNSPYATNPAYANTAARPTFAWPNIASSTGTLFNKSIFGNSRNPNYVATNTQVGQPYLWGNGAPNNMMGTAGFRPNSSPYTTPQPNWGIAPGNNYRDPVQGGMPATVLR